MMFRQNPYRSNHRVEVTIEMFHGGLNSMKMVDNASGGCHGSAKASDNGAAMVENTIPGNAENIENGVNVNLFEDGDMNFLSRFIELRYELGPLCL
ncbi:hypothetical protein V6N13_103527 [Hibiscus sabdariffa]